MRTERRSVGLDFLKAVAAACIVLHHFQQMSGATFSGVNFFILPDLFRTEYVFGWLTILFFMISGYLTSRQEQRTATPRRVPAQIWHKCLRLYPMAVLACLVYVALGFAHRALLGAWYWPLGGGGLWTVFNSLLVSYTNGTVALPGTAANNVTWYLSVLLNCYLIFYILVWLGRRTRVGWQQVIKHLPLTTAYANKAVTVVWGILLGLAVFGEAVTLRQVIGAAIIICGIVLFVRADNENREGEDSQ